METAKRRLEGVAQAFADIDDMLDKALTLGRDCHHAYLAAGPRLRRQMNQAFQTQHDPPPRRTTGHTKMLDIQRVRV